MLNADQQKNENAPNYWPEGFSANNQSKATYGCVQVEIVAVEEENMVKYGWTISKSCI